MTILPINRANDTALTTVGPCIATDNNLLSQIPKLIPMAAQSESWVCDRSLAGICGLDPRRGHGCISLVTVFCFHVGVPATGGSLIKRSPSECGVSEYDLVTSTTRRPRYTRAVEP